MKSRRRPTRRELEEHVRLPATPEEAARRIFAAARPPDPSKRKRKAKAARSRPLATASHRAEH